MMQRVLLIDSIEKLAAIAVPIRLEIIQQLHKKARSAKQLSKQYTDKSAQNLNYHFTILEKFGFIYKKYEERNRGAFEAFYQPVADILRLDARLLVTSKSNTYHSFKDFDLFSLDFCDILNQLDDNVCKAISFKSKKDLIDFIETNTFSASARFQLNVINK